MKSFSEDDNFSDWQLSAKVEIQNTALKGTSKLHNVCIFKIIKSDNFGVTVGILNINAISSKFDEFKTIVSGLFGIRTVTETKLDH